MQAPERLCAVGLRSMMSTTAEVNVLQFSYPSRQAQEVLYLYL